MGNPQSASSLRHLFWGFDLSPPLLRRIYLILPSITILEVEFSEDAEMKL
jgi:hypothetical protein